MFNSNPKLFNNSLLLKLFNNNNLLLRLFNNNNLLKIFNNNLLLKLFNKMTSKPQFKKSINILIAHQINIIQKKKKLLTSKFEERKKQNSKSGALTQMPPKQQQKIIRRAQGTPKSSTSFNKKTRSPSRSNGRRGRSRSQASQKSQQSASQTRRRQVAISWSSLSKSKDSRNSSKSYASRENWARLHKQTCKFWNNSRCTKGEECEYSHFHLKFFHKTQNFQSKGKAQLINKQYQAQINEGRVLVEVKQLKFLKWTEVQQLAQNLAPGVLEQAVSIATINKNAERNYKKELKQLKQFDDDPTHSLNLKVNAFNKYYDQLIKTDKKSDSAKKYKSNKSSQKEIDQKSNSNQNQNQQERMDIEYKKTNKNNNQKKNNQQKSPHNQKQIQSEKLPMDEEIDFDKKEIKTILKKNTNSEKKQNVQKKQTQQKLNKDQNEISKYKVSLKSPQTSQEYSKQNESEDLQDDYNRSYRKRLNSINKQRTNQIHLKQRKLLKKQRKKNHSRMTHNTDSQLKTQKSIKCGTADQFRCSQMNHTIFYKCWMQLKQTPGTQEKKSNTVYTQMHIYFIFKNKISDSMILKLKKVYITILPY